MRQNADFFLACSACLALVLAGCSETPTSNLQQSPQIESQVFHPEGQPKFELSRVNLNKPALIVFWATWCPSCVDEIPQINKIAKRYGDQLEIISVNVQEDPAQVRKFLQKNTLDYRVVLDLTGDIANRFQVDGLPSVVLLAKGGKILYYGYRLPGKDRLNTALLA